MLAATAKSKRFLKAIQLVLAFASTCTVIETSRIPSPFEPRPGYYAGLPHEHRPAGDRRVSDLARADRKRREAEQHSSRRGAELALTLEHRDLKA